MRLLLFNLTICFVLIVLTILKVNMVPIVFLAFLAAFAGWGIFTSKRERRTKETSSQKIAFSLGLSYLPSGRVELWANEDRSSRTPYWRFFSSMEQLSRPLARDILSGRFKNHEVMACSVVRGTDGDYSTITYFTLKHQKRYPQVIICDKKTMGRGGPKKWTGHIGFGQNPLAQKFSKVFCVYSSDETFARSACHANMMKYLLALHGELGGTIEVIEILGHSINLHQDGYHIDKTERRLNQLVEIYSLLPQASQ